MVQNDVSLLRTRQIKNNTLLSVVCVLNISAFSVFEPYGLPFSHQVLGEKCLSGIPSHIHVPYHFSVIGLLHQLFGQFELPESPSTILVRCLEVLHIAVLFKVTYSFFNLLDVPVVTHNIRSRCYLPGGVTVEPLLNYFVNSIACLRLAAPFTN